MTVDRSWSVTPGADDDSWSSGANGPPGVKSSRGRSVPLWVLVSAGWCVAALVYASHLYLYHFLRGEETRVALELAHSFAHFGVWALLTPVVFFLAGAWPLSGARRTWRALLHVPAALLVAMAQLLLHTLADHVGVHRGSLTGDLLWERFAHFFARTYYANVLVYAALVGAADLVAAGKRRRDRELRLERHLLQTQLDALRLQLQPHFLFNTLHSIASLIPRDPAAAKAMLARLGDLLRSVLDGRNAREIPLSRELAIARSYLEIEEIRFRDRLEVRFDVEDGSWDSLVPGLLLQPLLENAIRHGISRRPGSGTVCVGARRAGDRLRLVVRDDGGGLATGVREPEDRGGSGLGLENVRARLEHLYPGRHRFDLRGLPGAGTEVLIEIPFRTALDPAGGEAEGGAP